MGDVLVAGYWLGVDIGTTFTAAAVGRNGRVEVVQLGNGSDEIPTIVFVGTDGQVLVGDAAGRRGSANPGRVAREFKRRVGDPIPVLVGGSPYPAHALMARMFEYVLATVTTTQETAPAGITLTHPANWGPYKQDLLGQAARMAGASDVQLRSEPEAAAAMYATGEHIKPGEIVGVYDLGGGTFDAAVLRKTTDGFVLLGEPEGIEQLGGIDFDDAVFHHVLQALGNTQQLESSDDATRSALLRLRRDCIDAKESLSYDTVAEVPVALPHLHTCVRINRSELEDMLRPALTETVGALRRALRSAAVTPDQLRTVLLAGGSSRIPLVKQLIITDLHRPTLLGAHPKKGVALGAALSGAPPARSPMLVATRKPAQPEPDGPGPAEPEPNGPNDPRRFTEHLSPPTKHHGIPKEPPSADQTNAHTLWESTGSGAYQESAETVHPEQNPTASSSAARHAPPLARHDEHLVPGSTWWTRIPVRRRRSIIAGLISAAPLILLIALILANPPR